MNAVGTEITYAYNKQGYVLRLGGPGTGLLSSVDDGRGNLAAFDGRAADWLHVDVERLTITVTRLPGAEDVTLPASKRVMNGETVPGGMKARERLT